MVNEFKDEVIVKTSYLRTPKVIMSSRKVSKPSRKQNSKPRQRQPKNSRDPPVVNVEPWYDYNIAHDEIVTDAWYKPSWVHQQLKAQTRLELTDVNVMLKGITIWGKIDDPAPIGLQIFSPLETVTGEPSILATKTDAPGKADRAMISYKFRQPLSRTPIRLYDGMDDVGYVFGISGPVSLLHFHLCWRTVAFTPSAVKVVGKDGVEIITVNTQR